MLAIECVAAGRAPRQFPRRPLSMSEPKPKPAPIRQAFRRGEHFIWLTGAALAVCLLMIGGLLLLVLVNGLGFFWPHPLRQADLADGGRLLGAETRSEEVQRPDSEQ